MAGRHVSTRLESSEIFPSLLAFHVIVAAAKEILDDHRDLQNLNLAHAQGRVKS